MVRLLNAETVIKEATAAIRLFRAVPVPNHRASKIDPEVIKQTIHYGFVPTADAAREIYTPVLVDLVHKVLGLTPEEMNNAFHKSWGKVRDASMEQLLVEQLAHYMTTYGREDPAGYLEEKEEQWGVPSLENKVAVLPDLDKEKVGKEDYVYVPAEALKIPGLTKDFKIVIIRGLTRTEIKTKLMKLLGSGVALGEDTLKAIGDLIELAGIDEGDIEDIRNREIKSFLYCKLGTVPKDPVEFLRYVVFRATGKTLLIKNEETVEALEAFDTTDDLRVYEMKYGLERLAEIFLRFKPLFLAMKHDAGSNALINKIRKLAEKYHKPLPEDYLNTITARVGRSEELDIDRLEAELERVNVFRKIRLAYALRYRTTGAESILYKIRNGKGYSTQFGFGRPDLAADALDVVLRSIQNGVNKVVAGKKIFIPEHLEYSLPATEKMFTGNFPSGTAVKVSSDAVFGVHWDNVEEHRIDLDLSLLSRNGKFGWDAYYRSDYGDILFSGDMTTAPAPYGATELYYLRRQTAGLYLVLVNYYNYMEGVEVPIKILVARQQGAVGLRSHMVNPNSVLASAESKISRKQKILGLVNVGALGSTFYFNECYLGKSITSSRSEPTANSLNYLASVATNPISLNDVLSGTRAIMVHTPEGADIDLSPERLTKTSILDLLK